MKDIVNHNYHLFIYAVLFLGSLAFSFLINSLFLRFFFTLGIRNTNDGTVIRWGSMSKPAVGGLSFYIVFLLSLATYSIFFNNNETLYNSQFMGFIMAMAIGFLIGLADDAYNTKPVLKFLAQVSCAFSFIFTGTYIDLFDNMILNYLLTIFWVVGIMNSINMLDNMDGITATVSLGIIISAMVVITMSNDINNLYLASIIGLSAGLLGFLYFNWHPSKMYMGDTGSQFLGVFLAGIGIMFFWNNPYHITESLPIKKILTVAIAFLLPLVDTTVVVVNRVSKGKSPFIGGKDHTTHSLAYLGLKDNMVSWVYAGISLISVILVYVLNFLITTWDILYTVIFAGYLLIVLAVFFYTTSRIRAASKKPVEATP
ncbi:MAG TPA: MraY family glycosyltransferase, partial [Chitinophagaceae bacterium]|nr:MraY family glycosyltransferase [Chitinophagaceae bacterium]